MSFGEHRDRLERAVFEKDHDGTTMIHYDVPFLINEMKADYDRSAIDMLFPYWGCYIYVDPKTNKFVSDIPKPIFPMFLRKMLSILEAASEEKEAAQGTQTYCVREITDWDSFGCQMH